MLVIAHSDGVVLTDFPDLVDSATVKIFRGRDYTINFLLCQQIQEVVRKSDMLPRVRCISILFNINKSFGRGRILNESSFFFH